MLNSPQRQAGFQGREPEIFRRRFRTWIQNLSISTFLVSKLCLGTSKSARNQSRFENSSITFPAPPGPFQPTLISHCENVSLRQIPRSSSSRDRRWSAGWMSNEESCPGHPGTCRTAPSNCCHLRTIEIRKFFSSRCYTCLT